MSKNQYSNNPSKNHNINGMIDDYGFPGGRHGEHQEQRRDQGRRPRKDTRKQEAQEKQHEMHQMKRETEDILAQLEKQIDEDASNIGLVIAGLFKTLTLAHSVLPSMDLTTDLFHINVDMASISVNVFNPACLNCPDCSECNGEDESFFDDDFDDGFDDYDEDDDEEDSYEFDD